MKIGAQALASFLLAGLLIAALPEAGQAANHPLGPVSLKAALVNVTSDRVRLGDIFDGLGEKASTAVARAPEPGERVELPARWLAALARAYDLPWRPASTLDRVVVERASFVISGARIRTALLATLAEQGLEGDIKVVLDNPAVRLQISVEVEPSLGISGMSYDPGSGRFAAQMVVPAEGAAVARKTITGRALTMTRIPVLRRSVAPGGVIRAEDIGWLMVPTERLSRNLITEAESIVGMSPRRPIQIDQAVRPNELRAPVVVEKNSLVQVKLVTPRMVLTVQGRALEDGAQGKVIRVMNTKSNKIVNAVVTDSGTVEVPQAVLVDGS